MWVFAALPFLSAVRSGSGWRRTLLRAALCFGTAALILTPWLINNLVAYGDPLAWGLVTAVSDVRQAPMAAGDWLNLGVRLLGSAGGRFGGASHISALPAGYLALALFGVLALSGWMLYALRAKSSDIPLGVHRLLILFGVFWAVLLAAFVRWTLTALGTDQSRLLFPGISLLALFLVAGFARLFEHRQAIALQLLIVALCLVGAANLIYLGGIYAPPSGASAASAHPAADFEGTIRLLDYRLSTTRAAPGESVVVQFDWQSLKETSESYWLLLQLASPKEAVANKDGVPTAGRVTTDWWKKGQVLSGHHTLTLPPDIEPGTYELRIGLHPFGRWEWLRTGGRDMFVLSRLVVAPKE